MYIITVPTCLPIFYIVIVAMYFCMYFYFVTFLFFLIGNYLHFLMLIRLRTDLPIKCILSDICGFSSFITKNTPSSHQIIIPSYHHTITPLYHIVSSYHHTIIPSYYHIIIPSYHHIIIPSYEYIVAVNVDWLPIN